MYDYMRALEDRFAPRPNRKQRRKLEAKRQGVSALLDKEGKKKLLRLVDAHTMAQEEIALRALSLAFAWPGGSPWSWRRMAAILTNRSWNS